MPPRGSCIASVRHMQRGSKQGMISPSTTAVEGLLLRSAPLWALVVGVVLMLLVVLSRPRCRGATATPVAAKPPSAQRDPTPFTGFTRKPACPQCDPAPGGQ